MFPCPASRSSRRYHSLGLDLDTEEQRSRPFFADVICSCRALVSPFVGAVLAAAEGYVSRGLPLSVIAIDYLHWRHFGDFAFDPACWPDPPSMTAALERLGVRAMVSVWPFVQSKATRAREYNSSAGTPRRISVPAHSTRAALLARLAIIHLARLAMILARLAMILARLAREAIIHLARVAIILARVAIILAKQAIILARLAILLLARLARLASILARLAITLLARPARVTIKLARLEALDSG
eukprot:4363413-Pyramimonas_sp.AAC.3